MRGARAWPPPSHRRVVYPPAPSAHVGTYLAESHTRSRIGRPPLWPERRPRGGYHRAAHRTACGSLSISGTRPNGSWRIELTSGIEATANGGRQSLEDPLHPIAGRVGDRGEAQLLLRHGARQDQLPGELAQSRPKPGADEHQGEGPDLAALDQGRGLEELVKGPKPAGQADEGAGVLDQHDLADEEVAELDHVVKVGVRPLLVRQEDVAADAPAAPLLGPTVSRFHHPGTASGHDSETGSGQLTTDFAAQLVLRRPLPEERRAENCDSGTEAVELPETPLELLVDPPEPLALAIRGPGLSKELALLDVSTIVPFSLAQLIIQCAGARPVALPPRLPLFGTRRPWWLPDRFSVVIRAPWIDRHRRCSATRPRSAWSTRPSPRDIQSGIHMQDGPRHPPCPGRREESCPGTHVVDLHELAQG